MSEAVHALAAVRVAVVVVKPVSVTLIVGVVISCVVQSQPLFAVAFMTTTPLVALPPVPTFNTKYIVFSGVPEQLVPLEAVPIHGEVPNPEEIDGATFITKYVEIKPFIVPSACAANVP